MPKQKHTNFSDMDLEEALPSYEIRSAAFEVARHSVYISDSIGAPAAYISLIDSLRRASPHDEYTFYLNTPGGRVDTGMQLLNAMRDSEAQIITVLDPCAFSMGAILFLAGSQLIVPDNAQLMFHNYSGGLVGKGNEQMAEVQAVTRGFDRLCRDICHPFLTQEEINDIMKGRDMWLDSDDIRRRLKRLSQQASAPNATATRPRPKRKPTAAPAGQPN